MIKYYAIFVVIIAVVAIVGLMLLGRVVFAKDDIELGAGCPLRITETALIRYGTMCRVEGKLSWTVDD